MAAQIFKYPLDFAGRSVICPPAGAKIIHVGLDPMGEAHLWAEVDPANPPAELPLWILGTGHEIPNTAIEHVGSYVDGCFMWHVYTATP